MNIYERELNTFRKLNKIAVPGGIVLLGSTFAKDIPVGELKQTFDIDYDLYNRSLTDLSVFDAEALVDEYISVLQPRKILLQLGETDLERGFHTIPEIIAAYDRLMAKLKSSNKGCTLYILSVCDNGSGTHPEELNRQLEALARKNKCRYVDISSSTTTEVPCIKAFSILKFFIQDKISFSDAMAVLSV